MEADFTLHPSDSIVQREDENDVEVGRETECRMAEEGEMLQHVTCRIKKAEP